MPRGHCLIFLGRNPQSPPVHYAPVFDIFLPSMTSSTPIQNLSSLAGGRHETSKASVGSECIEERCVPPNELVTRILLECQSRS